ncbi:response regulator [Halobacillus litoralis]|uniref:response regulator n=1 Tax=Halobacillus litoralis TaxID=45668 RepID=UPI001CFC6415|nr:response regulator [Halobacillus litoralis]
MINVLLIEDDPMVQEVNRQFIEKVSPFKVIATASNGEEGVECAVKLSPDLIILDIYMPELDGVETLKEIRSRAIDSDVIVVTAAKEKETIRSMFQYGIVDYIIKPFKYERLQQSLLHYKTFRTQVSGDGDLSQSQVDDLIGGYSEKEVRNLPKGLNQQTLEQITQFLVPYTTPLSAEEVADGLGMARVTARRYLEYLQKNGEVEIDIQYGGVGRPVNRYQLKT